jgi:hypothetical protein
MRTHLRPGRSPFSTPFPSHAVREIYRRLGWRRGKTELQTPAGAVAADPGGESLSSFGELQEEFQSQPGERRDSAGGETLESAKLSRFLEGCRRFS